MIEFNRRQYFTKRVTIAAKSRLTSSSGTSKLKLALAWYCYVVVVHRRKSIQSSNWLSSTSIQRPTDAPKVLWASFISRFVLRNLLLRGLIAVSRGDFIDQNKIMSNRPPMCNFEIER